MMLAELSLLGGDVVWFAAFAAVVGVTVYVVNELSPKRRQAVLPVAAERKYMTAPRAPSMYPVGRSMPQTRSFAPNRNMSLALSPAIVGGNFKMNGNKDSIKELINGWGDMPTDVDVVVFPPFVYLDHTQQVAGGKVQVGAQNCWNTDSGAYTGEVSGPMLKDAGYEWVIIGHSERRSIVGETDELLGLKLRHALDSGLNVIYCIGEVLEEREAGITNDVCTRQMEQMKMHVKPDEWSKVVVAYEPVWAIGTGKVATPEQAQETHKAIRDWVVAEISPKVAEDLRIQYGGSVKAANAAELYSQPDINGFLVGGASLQPEFADICRFCAA